MRTRRIWLACAGAAVVAVAALFIAAVQPMAVRTYALEAPNQVTVAVLRPSEHVCEGPIVSRIPVRGVGIWGGPANGTARISVDVQNAATHAEITAGAVRATPAQGQWTAHLARTIRGGQPLRVCVTAEAKTFNLLGSAAQRPNVVMTGHVGAGQEFSLVLLSDTNRSLLTSLPLAFSRASLWRPGWVGSWTFWVLAAGLLGTFGLGVVAVTSAASADDDESGRTGPDDRGPDDPASRNGGGFEPARAAVDRASARQT